MTNQEVKGNRGGSENGAGTKNRTRDLLITSQLLYQLSYAGNIFNLDASQKVFLEKTSLKHLLLRGRNFSDFDQGWQVIYASKLEDFS